MATILGAAATSRSLPLVFTLPSGCLLAPKPGAWSGAGGPAHRGWAGLAGLGRVKTKVAEAGGGAPDTRPPGPRCWARARPPSADRLLSAKRAMQRKAFTFYIRYSPDYSSTHA